MSDFPIKRATADNCKGWVLYDQFPKPTRILGYFSDLDTAEDMAPKLLSLHERELAAVAAAEQAERDGKKPRSIKRKAG